MAYYELLPAYGRDYRSGKEAKADFQAGKDFQGDFQLECQLVNKEAFHAGDTVLLRFKKMTGVTSLTIKKT